MSEEYKEKWDIPADGLPVRIIRGGAGAWGGLVRTGLPGDVKVLSLGGGFYQVDFPRILQTGASVISSYAIPFAHMIIAMLIKHVDANLADAATALIFSSSFALRENLNFALASFTSSAPDEAFLYQGNEGAKNATNYIFDTNTTAGHFVYISMVVRALGEI